MVEVLTWPPTVNTAPRLAAIPTGAKQPNELVENHAENWHADPPTEQLAEKSAKPSPTPVTVTNDIPVDGALTASIDDPKA